MTQKCVRLGEGVSPQLIKAYKGEGVKNHLM